MSPYTFLPFPHHPSFSPQLLHSFPLSMPFFLLSNSFLSHLFTALSITITSPLQPTFFPTSFPSPHLPLIFSSIALVHSLSPPFIFHSLHCDFTFILSLYFSIYPSPSSTLSSSIPQFGCLSFSILLVPSITVASYILFPLTSLLISPFFLLIPQPPLPLHLPYPTNLLFIFCPPSSPTL